MAVKQAIQGQARVSHCGTGSTPLCLSASQHAAVPFSDSIAKAVVATPFTASTATRAIATTTVVDMLLRVVVTIDLAVCSCRASGTASAANVADAPECILVSWELASGGLCVKVEGGAG